MRAASGVMPAVGGRPSASGRATSRRGAAAAAPDACLRDPPERAPARAVAEASRGREHGRTDERRPAHRVDHYDDLEADEIVTLLDSLEDDDLDALLEYERANRARPQVDGGHRGRARAPEAARPDRNAATWRNAACKKRQMLGKSCDP